MRLIWARLSGAYERLLADLTWDTAACAARDTQERQTLIYQHLAARRGFEQDYTRDDLSGVLRQAFATARRPDPR